MSKVIAYYHIVFGTKHREMTLPREFLNDIYKYIYAKILDMKCDLKRIGGIENHIHLLVNLNPNVSLAKFMQVIKGDVSGWMRSDKRFVSFKGWSEGYFATTVTPEDKDSVINYIKGQQSHHHGESFDNELIGLYKHSDQEYDERDLQD